MKLQVMICTHGPDGLRRVGEMGLPAVPEVAYIVSCQSLAMPVPEALRRPDVEVFFTPTKGLSNNRNHAISRLTAPYALVADDDLTFLPDGLSSVVHAFDTDALLDLAVFRCRFSQPRRYPDAECDLRHAPRGFSPVSVEIAFRTALLREHPRLRFSPLLGIGAPRLNCGEEDVFYHRALRLCRHARFFPVVICEHPAQTTGERLRTLPATIRTKGAVIACLLPATTLLRLPLEACRLPGNKLRNLAYLVQGACYGFRNRHKIMR